MAPKTINFREDGAAAVQCRYYMGELKPAAFVSTSEFPGAEGNCEDGGFCSVKGE